ncbi:MAG: hypothetical protein KC609_04030 [Myxococcales bacterium]|nr:hypothetical protein [Myxococcales bacterium]
MKIQPWLRVFSLMSVVALIGSCSSSAKRIGSLCVSDNECGTALCLAGNCVALTSCQSESDCGGSGTCQQGKCWEESCNADTPCPYGECVGGYCVRLSETVDVSGGEDTTEDRSSGGEDAGCQSNDECVGQFPDLKPCEQALCSDGVCRRLPKLAGTTCNDNNGCTQTDQCDDTGNCVGTNPVSCVDPNNPCTANTECISLSATTHRCNAEINQDNGCDDQNACTLGDVCDDKGVCQPGKVAAPLGTRCGDEANPDKICGRFGDCGSFSFNPYTLVPEQYSTTEVPDRLRVWDLCKTSDGRLFLASQGLNDKPIDVMTDRTQYVALHEILQSTVGPPKVELTTVYTLGFEGGPQESVICDTDWLVANSQEPKALRYNPTTKLWATDGAVVPLQNAFKAVNQYGYNIRTLRAFYHQSSPVETFWFGGRMEYLLSSPEVDETNAVLRCCEQNSDAICEKGGTLGCVFEKMTPVPAQRFPDFAGWTIQSITGSGGLPWVLKSVSGTVNNGDGPWTLDNVEQLSPGIDTWSTSTAPGCDGFSPSSVCYQKDSVETNLNNLSGGWQDLARVEVSGTTIGALVGLLDTTKTVTTIPSVKSPALVQAQARLFDATSWNVVPDVPEALLYRRHQSSSGSFDLAQVTYGYIQGRITADGAYLVVIGGMVYCTDDLESEDCVLSTTGDQPVRYFIRPALAVYRIPQKSWVSLTPIAPPQMVRCCPSDTCTDADLCSSVINDFLGHNAMRVRLVETSTSFTIALLYNRPNPAFTPQGQAPPHLPAFLRFDSSKP